MTQRISNKTLEEIREKANDNIDLVFEALGIDVDLCTGFNEEIRCPCHVHGGDNPSGFCYNTFYRTWRCFTNNCHEGRSSIFGLAQAMLDIHFVQAVKWLAKLLNIPIESESVDINDETIEFSKTLKQAKIKVRVKDKAIQKFNLDKFDPFPISVLKSKVKPSWYFLEKGFTEKTLNKYYVGYCDDSRKPMYLRSFAPILDESGQTVIGVTGRIKFEKCDDCGDFHDQNGKGCPRDNKLTRAYAKWMHYGFSSSNVLYNSWNAKDYVRLSGVAIITEGPKEVWWYDQNEVHNAMCILGLNVHDYHISQLIKMGTRTIVVNLDNDEAGIEAAEKLNNSIGLYFKLINMKHLLKANQDIDDIDNNHMNNVIIPFLKSVEYVNA